MTESEKPKSHWVQRPKCPRCGCGDVNRRAEMTMTVYENYQGGCLRTGLKTNEVVLRGWQCECRRCHERWNTEEGMDPEGIQQYFTALFEAGE